MGNTVWDYPIFNEFYTRHSIARFLENGKMRHTDEEYEHLRKSLIAAANKFGLNIPKGLEKK